MHGVKQFDATHAQEHNKLLTREVQTREVQPHKWPKHRQYMQLHATRTPAPSELLTREVQPH